MIIETTQVSRTIPSKHRSTSGAWKWTFSRFVSRDRFYSNGFDQVKYTVRSLLCPTISHDFTTRLARMRVPLEILFRESWTSTYSRPARIPREAFRHHGLWVSRVWSDEATDRRGHLSAVTTPIVFLCNTKRISSIKLNIFRSDFPKAASSRIFYDESISSLMV